ncbi:putative membrane protein [Stella humosa]|uniref:Putative membrane protein n=1 Tax=Stella humosa TaxID=94 RepID=A0A3N1LGQ0_9PROT|nr:cytochrome c oxidase assembly protein [Stella humosa]ROP90592.1 putative membrane protein [Stella humosa]BBK29512.1 hypothetical protein STHU_01460 [Stella humosa]
MGEGIPYCGSGPLPDEIWGRWNGDPVLLGLLAAAGLLILLHPPGGVRRKACAAAAWAVLVLAFVSPLCALSSALFSARALHHLLLIAAAAPLIAAALPDAGPARRPGAGLLVATLAQTAALWLWHMPGPYAAALADGTLYWLMQATLLGSAVLFWSTLRTAAPAGAARLSALLAMVMQMGLLGALLTFVPAPLYAAHFATTLPWGLTPLEDQQLAGLVMWVPAALPYLAAALVPLAGWLAAAHRASPEPQG